MELDMKDGEDHENEKRKGKKEEKEGGRKRVSHVARAAWLLILNKWLHTV